MLAAQKKPAAQKASTKPATAAGLKAAPGGTDIAFELATNAQDTQAREQEADAAAESVVGSGTAGTGTPPGSEDGASGGTLPFGVIVDDGSTPREGQILRSDFVEQVTKDIEALANKLLAPTGRISEDCPYLLHWVEFYRNCSALHIERMIQRFAKPASTTLDGLRQALLGKIGDAVQAYIDSGGKEIRAPAGVEWMDSTDGIAVQTKTYDDSPSAAASNANPEQVRSSLRNPQPLNGGVRARMEQGFGRGLGGVRIHTDTHAGELARSLSARAFTVGSDIAFAPGEYNPGTLSGDLLLAHELAHVVQQTGSGAAAGASSIDRSTALETSANLGAARALARGPGTHRHKIEQLTGLSPEQIQEHDLLQESPMATAGGLQLQRCGEDEPAELAPAPVTLPETAAEGETPSEPGPELPPGAVKKKPAGKDENVPDVDQSKFELITDTESALLILGRAKGSTEHRLFALPAAGLVFQQRTAQSPATQTTPGEPSTAKPQPKGGISLPAAGHAGLHVVKTGKGAAVLVDGGGTRQGNAHLLQARSLQWLTARLGITEIEGALVTHTHADHVAGLNTLKSNGNITGNQLWVYPGQETTTVGPLGEQLKSGGWTVNTLTTREIEGPTGAKVTHSRLTVGEATFEMVTDTAKLKEFNDRLKAGRWSGSKPAGGGKRLPGATELADPASMFTRVSYAEGGPEALFVGDLRGRDMERLHKNMGEASFREFVGSAKVVAGFHHLGAVSTAADVRGLELLLKAMGGGKRPFTIVAQTAGQHEVNEDLVKALRRAGARVLVLGEPDPNKPSSITVSPSGKVTATGAKDYSIDEVTKKAQTRIERMERAVRVLETLTEYRGQPGKSKTQIAAGLRAEITRLEAELNTRTELSVRQLRSSTRSADVDQKLETNTANLRAVRGMEGTLGETEIKQLARTRSETEVLAARTKAALKRGEASEELRRLISTVDPQFAREIKLQVRELEQRTKSMSPKRARSEQREFWRNVRSRLEAQEFAQQALTVRSAPAGGRAKAAAWIGIALEAFHLAEPFITSALRESREQSHEDFYRFFRDLYWWNEKGLYPVAFGAAGGKRITDPTALSHGISKRLRSDLPDKQADKVKLPPGAEKAAALEQLYIPEFNRWPNGNQTAFWTSFLLWTSEHIEDYNDYASEFLETLKTAPVRQKPGDKKLFGDQGWQIRVGQLNSDGHVIERWQDSEDLTRIMNATAKRVIRNTEKKIETRWKERKEGPEYSGPSMSAPGSPAPAQKSERPTRRVRFAGGIKPVYYQMEGKAYRVENFHFFNSNPRFLELGGIPAPAGYVVITAGDYNTYAALRNGRIRVFSKSVKIPRPPKTLDPNDPDFGKGTFFGRKPEEYMSAEELAAHKLSTGVDKPLGVFRKKFSESESRMYAAEVKIYERSYNYAATVLVDKDDIEAE